mgnify:CR=1 FL=1
MALRILLLCQLGLELGALRLLLEHGLLRLVDVSPQRGRRVLRVVDAPAQRGRGLLLRNEIRACLLEIVAVAETGGALRIERRPHLVDLPAQLLGAFAFGGDRLLRLVELELQRPHRGPLGLERLRLGAGRRPPVRLHLRGQRCAGGGGVGLRRGDTRQVENQVGQGGLGSRICERRLEGGEADIQRRS